jgi:hypothetical protein
MNTTPTNTYDSGQSLGPQPARIVCENQILGVVDHFAHAPITTERMPLPEDFKVKADVWVAQLWANDPF